jgi:hypothetical protein
MTVSVRAAEFDVGGVLEHTPSTGPPLLMYVFVG